MRSIVLLLCLCATTTSNAATDDEENKELHRSLMGVVVIANRSQPVALSNERRKQISAEFRLLRKSRPKRSLRTKSDREAENKLIHAIIADALNAAQLRQLNRAVVHYYFEKLRPDLALDWLQIELTSSQRLKLQTIKITREQMRQLRNDRLETLVEYLQPFVKSDVRTSVGDLFVFQNPVLDSHAGSMYYLMPNVESIRVLGSPCVQSELGCTVDRVQQIAAMVKKYRREKLLFDDIHAETDHTEKQREKIRKKAIQDCDALLIGSQKSRFRQIVIQRYLTYQASEGLRLAIVYLGGRVTDEFEKVADRLNVETAAVRRLRLIPFVSEQVAAIVPKVNVENSVGEVSFFCGIDLVTVPKCDNAVARKLQNRAEAINPRRSGRGSKARATTVN